MAKTYCNLLLRETHVRHPYFRHFCMAEQANCHNSIWPTQTAKFAPSDQHNQAIILIPGKLSSSSPDPSRRTVYPRLPLETFCQKLAYHCLEGACQRRKQLICRSLSSPTANRSERRAAIRGKW